MLVQLNGEVAVLKTEVLQLSHTDPVVFAQKKIELDDKLQKRWIMVVGEGTVFLMFLTLAIINVSRSLRREEELARQQKNFLHSITHELKSPLASIKLYLQTLAKRELEKEKQMHFITQAVNDTERLNSLVENILLAAQIENKSFGYNKENVSFSALVHSVAEKWRLQNNKQIRILEDCPENVTLMADPMALQSLVENLIENAVKYAPVNSEVRIALLKKPKHVLLSVSDEGPGVPAAEQKHIFKKFYRIGNEETRANKGTGLGLYIVSQIAQSHKGTVSMRNNSPKGSTFEVLFEQ